MEFTKFNKTNRIEWGVDSSKLPFRKIASVYNDGVRLVKIRGFYFQNGKFGKQANAITDSYIMNLPRYATETIEQILDDPEAVESIKNGECWVRLYTYHSKIYNKDCFGFNFVDESEAVEPNIEEL